MKFPFELNAPSWAPFARTPRLCNGQHEANACQNVAQKAETELKLLQFWEYFTLVEADDNVEATANEGDDDGGCGSGSSSDSTADVDVACQRVWDRGSKGREEDPGWTCCLLWPGPTRAGPVLSRRCDGFVFCFLCTSAVSHQWPLCTSTLMFRQKLWSVRF